MPTALGTVASHRTAPAVTGPPAAGLVGWWDAADASTFTYSAGAIVNQWRDKSTAAHHLASAAGTEPTRDATINGVTAVRFDSGARIAVSGFAAAFVAAELFAVLMNTSGPPSAFLGQWSGDYQFYPFTDGNIYEPWGSSARKMLGNPGTSLQTAHMYNVQTAAGSYVGAINGAQFFTTATNTVAFNGTGTQYLLGHGGNTGMTGRIGEVLVYNRVLSTVERQQVEQYLAAKWITPSAPIPTTGLVGWWDADDATTFTYSSGTVVSEWRDKSGGGHHLGQGTVGNQPSRNGTQNGHPTVTFNGTSHSLTTPSWAMTKPVNVFVVARDTTGTESTQRTLFMPYQDGRIYSTSGGNGEVATYQGSTMTAGAWGASHRLVAAVFNDTASKLAVDGAAYTTGAGGGILFSSGNTTALGRHNATATEFWQGDVAELLVYGRELSTVERQQVETYLHTKWGTP